MARFNQSAQAALALAIAESEGMKHNYVGQEHLLLALAGDETNTATQLLATVGASSERVRSRIRFVIGAGDASVQDDRPYTPRMEHALALAEQEAAASERDEIDTAHLVLGLLNEGNGIGAGVLESFGLTVESARQAARRLLSEDDPDD